MSWPAPRPAPENRRLCPALAAGLCKAPPAKGPQRSGAGAHARAGIPGGRGIQPVRVGPCPPAPGWPCCTGVSINPQMMRLRGGADVVVATPGRLLDLVQNNALRLGQVQHLVLDEADRLLDLGFPKSCKPCCNCCRSAARTCFSRPPSPKRWKRWRKPAARPRAHRDCRHRANPTRYCPTRHRGGCPQAHPVAQALIEQHQWSRVLVFATQYAADHVAEKLYKAGIYASPFHGGLSQASRAQVVAEFRMNAGRWW